MLDLETKTEAETEDFADGLSDEALDRGQEAGEQIFSSCARPSWASP
jgi:hypothetical protein